MHDEHEQTNDTPENNGTDNAAAAEFEELIQGRCKELFQARVQKILEGRLRTLRRENELLHRHANEQRRYEAECVERLTQEAENIRRLYGDFDWQQEMRDPTFCRLIAAGIDGRTAYEAIHHRELLAQAMRFAARRGREQASRAVASGGRRIAENGGSSAAVTRSDPRALTPDELAEIRKRVRKGEKIRF